MPCGNCLGPALVNLNQFLGNNFNHKPNHQNTMKIKAAGNTIIIRRVNESVNSKILIPEIAELNTQHGVVVAVGPGSRDINGNRIPISFKEGDHVVFNRLGIVNITVGSEALCAVKEQDIFGTLEE